MNQEHNILFEAGAYYLFRLGTTIEVRRNSDSGTHSEVHGAFPDSQENRARCIRYCERRAKVEAK